MSGSIERNLQPEKLSRGKMLKFSIKFAQCIENFQIFRFPVAPSYVTKKSVHTLGSYQRRKHILIPYEDRIYPIDLSDTMDHSPEHTLPKQQGNNAISV